jgi:hypothetical protein
MRYSEYECRYAQSESQFLPGAVWGRGGMEGKRVKVCYACAGPGGRIGIPDVRYASVRYGNRRKKAFTLATVWAFFPAVIRNE